MVHSMTREHIALGTTLHRPGPKTDMRSDYTLDELYLLQKWHVFIGACSIALCFYLYVETSHTRQTAGQLWAGKDRRVEFF